MTNMEMILVYVNGFAISCMAIFLFEVYRDIKELRKENIRRINDVAGIYKTINKVIELTTNGFKNVRESYGVDRGNSSSPEGPTDNSRLN